MNDFYDLFSYDNIEVIAFESNTECKITFSGNIIIRSDIGFHIKKGDKNIDSVDFYPKDGRMFFNLKQTGIYYFQSCHHHCHQYSVKLSLVHKDTF